MALLRPLLQQEKFKLILTWMLGEVEGERAKFREGSAKLHD